MSDTPEPRQPRPSLTPGKPLPRLWKEEPEEAGPKPDARAGKPASPEKTARQADSTGRSGKPKTGRKAADAKGSERKALVEETPAFDTYEARQRARLAVGGLVIGCVLIFGWITYRIFLYDPSGFDVPADDPSLTLGSPEPKPNLDNEAQFMLNRAHDHAKNGRTDEALALLTRVTKVYKGTKSAVEAKAALDRPKQNLPLFLDRPAVTAETSVPEPPASPTTPPAVVAAQPPPTGLSRGNAVLVPPVNPAELTPTQPSPLAINDAARTVMTPRPVPHGFKARLEAGVHATGWPLVIVSDRDGAPMVLVPGGTFTMGDDSGAASEAPAHQVRLSTYYIDQHEVTIRQFRLFLKESHYRGQPPRNWAAEDLTKVASESSPMVMVNARDARSYADWASKRLPSEAQWEMAARSTDSRLYSGGPQPIEYARPREHRKPEPVMSYPEDVSPYGVFDLAGNVLEWTSDWYDSRYYRQLGTRIVDNPTGPRSGPRSLQLVVKGGSKTGKASAREGIPLDKRLPYVGFRCVLPVEGSAGPLIQAPGQPPTASPPPAPGAPDAPSVPF